MNKTLSWDELSQLFELLQMVEKEKIVFGEKHTGHYPSPNEDSVAQIVALDLQKKFIEAGIDLIEDQVLFLDDIVNLFAAVILEGLDVFNDKSITDLSHPVITKFVFESSQKWDPPEAWSGLMNDFLKYIRLGPLSTGRFTWYYKSFFEVLEE